MKTAGLAVILGAFLLAGVPTSHVPTAGATGGEIELQVHCTPPPPYVVCTYTVSVTNLSIIFFRWDFNADATWDFPAQTGCPQLGCWSTLKTVVRAYPSGGPPPRACVQGWDGVSTRMENGKVVADGPVACADVAMPNSPPVPNAGGPYFGRENSQVTFTARGSSDPDGDVLQFRWDFQNDGTWDTPWSYSTFASFTWGDDWTGLVRLEASDGRSTANATATVVISDVAPTITDVQMYVAADLALRVTGGKRDDVRMDLVWNNAITASAHVVRYPGSSDRQEGTITGGRLQLLGAFSIVLYYTPADDPVNGQPNGANPVWVILTLPDGSQVRLHHTFNVQHPDTWVWTISDLRPYLVGQRITFDAIAHDVGSDDLTFAWSFGDGTGIKTTFYNNGVSPDPYLSPEVNPITANDEHTHAFALAGTYAITLTITDDDGGTVAETLILPVGS